MSWRFGETRSKVTQVYALLISFNAYILRGFVLQASSFDITSINNLNCRSLETKLPGFSGGSVVTNLPANTGDTDLIPVSGRSHMPRSNYACTPKLLSLCPTARETQLLKPVSPRAHVWQQEKPPMRSPWSNSRVALCLLQLEKTLRAATKTQHNGK